MNTLLKEFLDYANDVLDLEISYKKSSNPDSFKKIFGESFLPKQTNSLLSEEDKDRTCEIINHEIKT